MKLFRFRSAAGAVLALFVITTAVPVWSQSAYGSDEFERAPLRTGTYTEGLVRGRLAAQSGSGGGMWFGVGFGSGCLFSALGCAGATGAAYIVEPGSPPPDNAHLQTDEFVRGYMDGYEKQTKKKRASAAFLGGAVGTALFVGLYVLATGAAASSNP